MECPKCGDNTLIYRKADLLWDPRVEAWIVEFMDEIAECTECDAKFMIDSK